MVTFTVHEKGEPAADRMDRAEELVFVKDGFNFSAAVFAPMWLLANALWFEFVGYVAALMAIGACVVQLGMSEMSASLALVAVHLIIGAEADSLRRAALSRRGWSTVGTVVGRNLSECERRFFDTWLEEQPLLRRDGIAGPPPLPVGGGRATASSTAAYATGMMHDGADGMKSASSGAGSRRWWPFGRRAGSA